jgi:hypothetical protein
MSKTFEEIWYERLREYVGEDVWIDLVDGFVGDEEE